MCVRAERECVHLPRKLGSHPDPASETQTESNVIMILYDTYTVSEHDMTSSFTTTAATINTTAPSTNTMKKTFIDPTPGQLQTACLKVAGIQHAA